jgi:hypothetical protein
MEPRGRDRQRRQLVTARERERASQTPYKPVALRKAVPVALRKAASPLASRREAVTPSRKNREGHSNAQIFIDN